MTEYPATIVETPEYDYRDPLHFALWLAAGSPDLNELDGDGNKWRPTIVRNRINNGPDYDMPQAPSLEEIYKRSFERSQQRREAAYSAMKGAMAAAMQRAGVPLQDISREGAAFFDAHSAVIFAWIGGGGNAFKTAVEQDSRPWLDFKIPQTDTSVRDVCLSFFV